MLNPETVFETSEKLSYEHVSLLDPLEVDEFMASLPELNLNGDITAIVETLKYAIDYSKDKIKKEDIPDALAALRDIDFLISSLLRHGLNPLDEVESLEEELMRLGQISGTVARGTVYTYTVANPTDQRQRTFTGTTEESSFIDAVRESCLALDTAVDGFSRKNLDTSDKALSEMLQTSLEAMQVMTSSIVSVRRSVSPEFFSNNMRPFFEPITIGGRTITGAGGAQMQMLALDSIMWGIDSSINDYKEFFQENAQYLPPNHMQVLNQYEKNNEGMSVLSTLEMEPDKYIDSLIVFENVMAQIKKFRYPHRTLAKENFKIRSDSAVGSGQYKPSVLDTLVDATQDALSRTQRIIDAKK